VGLELTKLKQKLNQLLVTHDTAHNFAEGFVLTLTVQHDPTDGRVGVPERLCQRLHVVQGFFFLELTVNNVLFQLFAGSSKLLCVEVCKVLNTVLNDVVSEALYRCGESGPEDLEVHKLPAVDWDDPVVWEVLVTNLTHLGLLVEQDVRHERQQREDD
jgi:hypothetical protein